MTLGVYGPTYCACGEPSDPIAGQCEACYRQEQYEEYEENE